MNAEFWYGNLSEIRHLEDEGDKRITSSWVFRKQIMRMWCGWFQLWIMSHGEYSYQWYWIFGFCYQRVSYKHDFWQPL